jgi:hypothetical protein
VPAPAVVPGESVEAGAARQGLLPDEAEYWTRWAPLAQAGGLLHAGTVPGFVLLCQWAARADTFWLVILERGLELERVTIDGAGQEHREYRANGLISQWRSLTARVEQGMARYGLTGDGKVPMGEPAADDEEATLARILRVK